MRHKDKHLSCSYHREYSIETQKGTYAPKYKCPFPCVRGSSHCIFHLPNSEQNKNTTHFFEELRKVIDRSLKYDLKLFCNGFIFPKIPLGNFLNQTELSFKNDVLFEQCEFDDLFLQSLTFHKNVYFNDSIFNGDCWFNYCTSNGKAIFRNTVFKKKLQFNNHCNGDLDFENSEFHGPVEFFPLCNGSMYLSKSLFHDSVSFYNANFWGKENSFISTTFRGKVNFESTRFTHVGVGTNISITRFERCDFDDEVEFINTDFAKLKQRIITFSYDPQSRQEYDNKEHFSTFINNLLRIGLNYENVKQQITLSEKLDKIEINDAASNRRIILKLSLFDKTIRNLFSPKSAIKGNLLVIHPEESRYNRKMKFILNKSNEEKELYFVNDFKINPVAIPLGFDYSTFRKRVRFVGLPDRPISLEGISFKGVDLSNVEFHNVVWIEKHEIVKGRMIIVDELFDKQYSNYEEISKIYNQLRKNYESKLLFNEASNFFVGEMEAIRKSKWYRSRSISKMNTISYLLYKYLSLYGESIKLPLLIWTPLVIMIFGLIEFYFTRNTSLFSALKKSFFAFFQVPYINSNLLSDYIATERIISLPILGLAFIALRRRFERSK
jgi:hypothetical protein